LSELINGSLADLQVFGNLFYRKSILLHRVSPLTIRQISTIDYIIIKNIQKVKERCYCCPPGYDAPEEGKPGHEEAKQRVKKIDFEREGIPVIRLDTKKSKLLNLN